MQTETPKVIGRFSFGNSKIYHSDIRCKTIHHKIAPGTVRHFNISDDRIADRKMHPCSKCTPQ